MFSHNSFLALGLALTVASAAPSDSQARDLQARQSYLGGTQSGDAIFYNVGLGACGITNNDSDFVVAMSSEIFNNYPGYNGDPSDNPICGQQINVQYQGNSVQVTIVDECSVCPMEYIDLSPAAFEALADLSLGLIPITWEWA